MGNNRWKLKQQILYKQEIWLTLKKSYHNKCRGKWILLARNKVNNEPSHMINSAETKLKTACGNKN